jgi:hypothetical protein
MDAYEVQDRLNKASSVYIIDKDPAIILLFESVDELNDAVTALNTLFEKSALRLSINYYVDYIQLNLHSEVFEEFVVIEKKNFHNPLHFQLIKPLHNKFHGMDINGENIKGQFSFQVGQLQKDGNILGGTKLNGKTTLWHINDYSLTLAPQL